MVSINLDILIKNNIPENYNDFLGVVYCYTYIPDKRKYFGQTRKRIRSNEHIDLLSSLKIRHSQHLGENKTNLVFHNLLKTETSNFILEIFDFCHNERELNEKEKFYIKKYNTNCAKNGFGFNLTDDNSPPINSGSYEDKYGIEKAREIKQKLSHKKDYVSKALKGKTYEEKLGEEKAFEVKQLISKKLKGHSVEPETRLKISVNSPISKFTDEQIKEIMIRYISGDSSRTIAKNYNCDKKTILRIINFTSPRCFILVKHFDFDIKFQLEIEKIKRKNKYY